MCLKCIFGGSSSTTVNYENGHANGIAIKLEAIENNSQTQQNGQVVQNVSDIHLEDNNDTYAKALFSFNGVNEDDLSFEKGDMLEILEDDGVWWRARLNGIEGLIPSNFVQYTNSGVKSLESWMIADRREAERNLLLPGYEIGTYLIRPCSGNAPYALSIRFLNPITELVEIKHYKIRKTDDDRFFVTGRLVFVSVNELIEHYCEKADGLACKLTNPCPKTFRPPVEFRDIEVNREAFTFCDKLGNGNFGEVYKAKWNRLVEVAIKTIKAEAMEKEAFIEEAEVMHNLRHPKILQILGICTQGDPVLIITELMVNGALLSYLRNDKDRIITYSNMIDMIHQIADGMSYLEEKNYVHRDLRAANILVGENYSVKVSDFGLTKFIEEDIYSPTTSNKFPVRWTPPEAYNDSIFSTKSDVWSFGVLIYEIVTFGKTPYKGKTNQQVMVFVNGKNRLEFPTESPSLCDKACYEIMMECWKHEADDRPTFIHLKDKFDNFTVATEAQYSAN